MCVEKVPISEDWQLYVALFTDVTNLKDVRQSVIDGQLDVALISPAVVRVRVCLNTENHQNRGKLFQCRSLNTIYRRMIAIGAYVHFLAFLTLYGSNRFFTLYNMETK